MKKGLYKQIDESDPIYKDVSLDIIVEYAKSLGDYPTFGDDNRIFVMHSGKLGAINYELETYRQLGKTKAELMQLEYKMQQEFEEGMYRMDKYGLTYLG